MLTNRKRIQCERPREKRAVLRERKDTLGSAANKEERVEGVIWFQSEGPMIAKAHVSAIVLYSSLAGQRDHDVQVSEEDGEMEEEGKRIKSRKCLVDMRIWK